MRIDEWRQEIGKNFKEFVLAAEIGLSVICQLLIEDITNPFGLVYVDAPSSGKTITLNFFNDIEELVYTTDSFTAASFVSHAANRKTKDLEKIDLLPRVREKVLIVRDLAPIFGMRDDDLVKTMGTLTRVFDGEGLQTDGGCHGQRGYSGDYLFMFLAASTPIKSSIWKTMANFGSRLFFFNMNTPDKDDVVLASQLSSKLSAREKEKQCRIATKKLINTIWSQQTDGIYWDKENESPELLEEIARIAKLVAHLRGAVEVWNDKGGDINHSTPIIEKPDRINQAFYNLARGHAVACGRTLINDEDIAIIVKVALSSADMNRTKILRAIINNERHLTTNQTMGVLNCSRPWALKQMEIMKILGIAEEDEVIGDGAGHPQTVIKLRKKFSWFNSERFKELDTYIQGQI